MDRYNQKPGERVLTEKLQAIILAAGKSSRFNTSLTKLGFTICGQEMIAYPLRLLSNLSIKTTLVVGYQKEVVLAITKKHNFSVEHVEQNIPKGTGHAVLASQEFWTAENILILNGDVPLLNEEHLKSLIDKHISTNATLTFAAAYNADPSVAGYGRIIRENGVLSIVEQREFNGNPEDHCHLNAGIYLIKRTFLEAELTQLSPSASGEIYITDLIKKASQIKERIEIVDLPFDYVRGVNTLKELWVAEQIKKSDIITHFMNQGVRFAAPQTVHVDLNVTIEADTFIGYGVQLCNGTKIGSNVHIDAFSIIDNARIHDGAIIHSHSRVQDAEIHTASQVGPFAHIHKESTLSAQTVIGNFVEVSRSSVGLKTKAKHLAYIGNAEIGAHVNIGAGAITCNYNGVSKHTTTINNRAFIGVNTSLIAPVTIGEGALIAAGSVITKDVPEDALAIARMQQITKEHYASKLKERYKQIQEPIKQTSKKEDTLPFRPKKSTQELQSS